jgi:ferric-dicitrate binding protein FerR (iron transport regulator)
MHGGEELERLIHRYLEGGLDENEAARLNEMVKSDAEAARRLARMSFDHAQFGDVFTARPRAVPVTRRERSGIWTSHRFLIAAAAAVVIVAVTLLLLPGSNAPATPGTGSQAVRPARDEKAGDAEVASENRPQDRRQATNTPDEKKGLAEKPQIPPEREWPKLPEMEKIPERPQRTEPQRETVADVPRLPETPPQPVEPEKRTAPVEPQEPPAIASIGEASGSVKIKRAGQWQEAGVLLSIRPGDLISTGGDGAARVDFESGDRVYMNKDGQITLSESMQEIALTLDRGEVYVEKETCEGVAAIKTGFGKVTSPAGRFSLTMSGADGCLLNVLEGEVECRESSKGHSRKYQAHTQAWFRRGKACEEGRELGSGEEVVGWAQKMRPARPPLPPRLSPEAIENAVRKMMRDFDTDGDGKLSFEELDAALEETRRKKHDAPPPKDGRRQEAPPAGR